MLVYLNFLLKDSILPTKICISINSKSLGYTLFPQDDEDLLMKTTINNLLIEIMILYAGRQSEKVFLNEVTCGAEDDYMKARKILKRLLMNGMLVSEYNLIENSNSSDSKIPDYIEKKITLINKKIVEYVKGLLEDNSIIVKQTANKIIESNSIVDTDIFDIFNQNNMTEKIGSFDILTLYYDIKKNVINCK